MGPDLAAQVRVAVAGAVADGGADLEDVEVVRAGKRTVVRLVVDTDGGVSLDDVAALNRAAGEALEAAGVMGQRPYVLEVSSPGVGRPLTLPRHWRRNRGRLVRVRFTGGGAPLEGRIVTVTDEGVELLADTGPTVLPFGDIERAVVQVEFTAPEGG